MPTDIKRDQLYSIIDAFAQNYRGFVTARIVALTSSRLILSCHLEEDVKAIAATHRELREVLKVDAEHWENFNRFSNEMGWVFVVAILDTFVNDLVLFMCMSQPETFLTRQSIAVSMLAKKSNEEIIHEESEKFLLSVGKNGLLAKISLLAEKIGQRNLVAGEYKQKILHALGKRNEIVHRRGARHLYPGWQPKAAATWEAQDSELVETAVQFARLVWRIYCAVVIDWIGEKLEPREEQHSKLLDQKHKAG